MKETELGPPLIAWAEARGFDMYQEVDGRDAVGIMGKRVAVFELKVNLTFKVLRQAWGHAGLANWTYAVVPKRKLNHDALSVGGAFCRDHGIGLLLVDGAYVHEREPAMFFRRAALGNVIERCVPECKANPAGAPSGPNVWTPFKGTTLAIERAVKAKPGMTLKELLTEVGKCHYANDKSFLSGVAKSISKGWMPLRVERDGRTIRVWPLDSPQDPWHSVTGG